MKFYHAVGSKVKPAYVTGVGQKMYDVHPHNAGCDLHGCVIHNPTDPHQDWPTKWDMTMVRVCPHGVSHPDKDEVGYIKRMFGAAAAEWAVMHACDGCCDILNEDKCLMRVEI